MVSAKASPTSEVSENRFNSLPFLAGSLKQESASLTMPDLNHGQITRDQRNANDLDDKAAHCFPCVVVSLSLLYTLIIDMTSSIASLNFISNKKKSII